MVVSPSDTSPFGNLKVPLTLKLTHSSIELVIGFPSLSVIVKEVITSSWALELVVWTASNVAIAVVPKFFLDDSSITLFKFTSDGALLLISLNSGSSDFFSGVLVVLSFFSLLLLLPVDVDASFVTSDSFTTCSVWGSFVVAFT